MSEPLLDVRDVHVRFQGRKGTVARAVDGVDLEMRPGEVLALVGESGCGKTTLARTILGLEQPVQGEIRFRGSPLEYGNAALRRYRRQVQMVFQDPTGSLNPRQTIYEAVAEGLRIQKVEGNEVARVADALSRAGLRPPERFMPLYPYEVSGGQRQRVVIAGAMVLEPELLVADEPVSSLDASVRGEILELMLRLVQDTGVAILVVTHDLGLAWNIADRIAVMYLGRIVEQGSARVVVADPQHPYTRALVAAVPRSDGGRRDLALMPKGEAPDPSAVPSGCRFHPRCPVAEERCARIDPPLLEVGGPDVGAGPDPDRAAPRAVACVLVDGVQPASGWAPATSQPDGAD